MSAFLFLTLEVEDNDVEVTLVDTNNAVWSVTMPKGDPIPSKGDMIIIAGKESVLKEVTVNTKLKLTQEMPTK